MSIAAATVQNFNEEERKKGHKKIIDIFQNSLLIGELDNENEPGGLILRSPSVDKQGIHRLERGKYFFNKSKDIAKEMEIDFNWKLVIVPNIGHDYRKMGDAAAKYLYGGTE